MSSTMLMHWWNLKKVLLRFQIQQNIFIYNIESFLLFFLGPCGGKTTGQARLSTFFENLGWKVNIFLKYPIFFWSDFSFANGFFTYGILSFTFLLKLCPKYVIEKRSIFRHIFVDFIKSYCFFFLGISSTWNCFSIA